MAKNTGEIERYMREASILRTNLRHSGLVRVVDECKGCKYRLCYGICELNGKNPYNGRCEEYEAV